MTARAYEERLERCRDQIGATADFRPQVAVVLGTGLGEFADSLDVLASVPYGSIDGWPVSTSPGHEGRLVLAERHGIRLAVMCGRAHRYEGYSGEDVALPLRVLHMLGADTAILSNAAASLNRDYAAGEFVCVEDQISSFVPSPLVGRNIDGLGVRFPSMTDAFDAGMRCAVMEAGRRNGIPVHGGTYIQVGGPQFETPAEIRMYRMLGADTLAMSLGDEVIVARHMGMRVCAINCIANMAAGMGEEPSLEAVRDRMGSMGDSFRVLVDDLLDSL